jgi:hypothetical protein
MITNLNANYLGGTLASGFVGTGSTGNFITTLNNGVGISITGSGVGRTIAIDYDSTLDLAGNKIGLNLGNANTWTALQTFSAGATISTLSTTGNVSIGGTLSVTSRANFANNIYLGDNLMIEGIATERVYRNLATYTAGSGSSGAFIIQTNIPGISNQMSRIKIEGYFYDITSPFEIIIGGYFYSGGGGTSPTITNSGYINTGSNKLAVRFAIDAGTSNVAIILGNEASNYSYPKLTVTSFMQGHTNINESYAEGWTITQTTSLANYFNLATIADKTAIPASQVTAGTFGAGNFTFSNNLSVGGTVTGQIFRASANGTVSIPAFSWTSDPDNGLYYY